MPFRYRYPGEEWKETSAETYTIQKIYGTPYFDVRCEATSADERLPGGIGAEVQLGGHLYLQGLHHYLRLNYQSYPWATMPDIGIRRSYGGGSDEYVGLTLVPPPFPARDRSSRDAVIYRGTPSWNYRLIQSGSIRNLRVIYTGYPPYNDDFYCIFSLFNSRGNQFFHRTTQNFCPEIEEESDGCPEGTCEVTCGDTICCYGSDGIAVDSFPRT